VLEGVDFPRRPRRPGGQGAAKGSKREPLLDWGVLLVAARLPPSPDRTDTFARAARITGLAAADVRSRLAGPLPRVLHIDADPERARQTADDLEDLGFVILVCDPRAAPGDDDRLVTRGLRLSNQRLWVTDGAGAEEEVALESLALIQRGIRATTLTEVTKKAERRLDLTRALLTGGLLLTKKVDTKSIKTTTSREGFLLLHRNNGERDVIIYERRIDYRFLEGSLSPSSAGNFDRLITRLRQAAPHVPYDDRTCRPGFLSGLPVASSAVVDVALWLVQLAQLRGLAVPPSPA
jgi:hypothetical protein